MVIKKTQQKKLKEEIKIDIESKEESKNIISEKTKMADVILSNNKLMFVLPRFGLKFGMGEKNVKELCEEADVPSSLFLLVCNVYSDPEYKPSQAALHSFDLADLLVYLHNSHSDYLDVRIPAVQRKIMKLAELCGNKGTVLIKFFDEYIREVKKHFSYEESKVFPYIEKLLTNGKQKDFNIATYQKNHTDIEDKLTELKNILIKYVPQVSLEVHREALLDLFLFEDDLDRHSLIENRIVVPLVSEIENTTK